MKKEMLAFTMLFLCAIFTVSAQKGFGVKAGLSYNSNGDLKEFSSEVTQIYKDKGKGKSGFNVGVYGQLELGPIYLRPELVYTKTTSEYEINNATEDFNVSKLDLPVLVGLKVLGPLHVFAGPAFQYYLENDLGDISIGDVENDFTVGMNIGASVQFGRLGLDVRYERGLSENEAKWTNAGNTFTLDHRPEQLIFSLSYSLSKN